MTDIPPGALAAAEEAIIRAASDFSQDDIKERSSRKLARAALEAAAPILADACAAAILAHMPRGPRGEYRRHILKVGLTDPEYAVLAAESVRQQKPMAALVREAFFAPADELVREDDGHG